MSYRADGSYDPQVAQSGSTSGGTWQGGGQEGDAYRAAHRQADVQYPGGMQHANPYGGQQPGISSSRPGSDETFVASSGYGVAPDLFAPPRRGGRVLVWVVALGLAFGAGLAVGRASVDDDSGTAAVGECSAWDLTWADIGESFGVDHPCRTWEDAYEGEVSDVTEIDLSDFGDFSDSGLDLSDLDDLDVDDLPWGVDDGRVVTGG